MKQSLRVFVCWAILLCSDDAIVLRFIQRCAELPQRSSIELFAIELQAVKLLGEVAVGLLNIGLAIHHVAGQIRHIVGAEADDVFAHLGIDGPIVDGDCFKPLALNEGANPAG